MDEVHGTRDLVGDAGGDPLDEQVEVKSVREAGSPLTRIDPVGPRERTEQPTPVVTPCDVDVVADDGCDLLRCD